MWIVYGLLSVAGGVILLFAWRETKKTASDDMAKRTITEKAGYFLYRRMFYLGGKGKCFRFREERERKLRGELALLEPGTDKGQQAVRYQERCLGEVFLLLWACAVFALLLSIRTFKTEDEEIRTSVVRNRYEEGSREDVLTAESGGKTEEIRFTVTPRRYTVEEVMGLYEDFLPALEKRLFAENPGPDAVREPVCLVSGIEGFPFTVRWENDEKGVILPDGSLKNEELGEEGMITMLRAVISYENFEREYEIAICVLPPVYTAEELFWKKLQNAVKEREEQEPDKESFVLPDHLDGIPVIWRKKRGDYSLPFFLLGPVAGGLLLIHHSEERKKKLAERERALEEYYPEFVTRMALLLGAGMTVRSAFRKMAGEGESVWGVLAGELQAACREMDAGIPESQAYLHFGKRCLKKQYKKLATLLTQNLKKGSRGLLEQMLQEAHIALEEQKSRARRLGEEAGTKLLLPMTGMLVVTMLLIIVPAYGSFGI